MYTDSMEKPKTLVGKIAFDLFIVIGIILFIQAFITDPKPPKRKEKACKGEPIYVDYPYETGYLEPWACKVQCDDQQRRYIVYSNGKTTQCEKLPGCRDWGEDHGETCKRPDA